MNKRLIKKIKNIIAVVLFMIAYCILSSIEYTDMINTNKIDDDNKRLIVQQQLINDYNKR